jgi:hypothetical protein
MSASLALSSMVGLIPRRPWQRPIGREHETVRQRQVPAICCGELRGSVPTGLVWSLSFDPFGYSSPLFRLAPTPAAAPQASGGGGAAAAAPVVVAPSAGVKVPLTPSSARFAPEIFAGERSAAQALVGGKPVDVTSSVEGAQKATFEVGSVTLGLGVAADNGAVSTKSGLPCAGIEAAALPWLLICPV